MAPFREAKLLPVDLDVERRADGEFARNRQEVAALKRELGELRALLDTLTRSNGR